MFGFLNINKPEGITSFDVIAQLRKIFNIKQIGHAGTLDPMATGVLPIGVGKAARLLEFLDSDKAYICECEFGKISNTYDTEGDVEFFAKSELTFSQIEKALSIFKGNILQKPPLFSAVHHNGKRLYELARKGGKPDDIKPRKVCVYEINLLEFDETNQSAKIFVKCSSGTYIRSIIHDLGQLLGVGAVMTELTRVEAGRMKIENSVTIDELKESSVPCEYLLNPVDVLSCKKKILTDSEYRKVICGVAIEAEDTEACGSVLLIKDGEAVAIGQTEKDVLKIKKVFIK